MSRFEPMVRWWSATSRSLPQFAPARRPYARRRLRLERLEDRTMLSTIALMVDSTADASPPLGVTTLREAITQADADPANQYVINFNLAVKATIDLTSRLPDLNNNIVLEGPGASDLTVQRDPSAVPFSVFTVDGGVTVSLSGITIAGGDAVTSGAGGGLDNSGTLTVSNSVFANNSARFGNSAGGLYNEPGGSLTVSDSSFTENSGGKGGGLDNEGTATVSDSTFTSNSTVFGYGEGGGLYNGGTLTVSDSTFTGNNAGNHGGGLANSGTATVSGSSFTSNYGDHGGGLANSGTATVSGSSFTSNHATDFGGGIENPGTATIINSVFSSNSVGNGSSVGGGLYNSGTATVIGSTFTSNSVYFYGGGLYNFQGTATVIGSTFTSNSATIYEGGYGGGLYNFQGTATVIGSTFTSNSASADGGGLANYGTATLTNCTVSGNTSQHVGGGIANRVGGGNLTLNNTIVAGNTSTGTSDNDIFGQVQPTSAFNLIGDGSGIVNLTDLEESALSNLIGTTTDPLNPLLGPLADNGGPTLTMALLPGSPAIDAGSNTLAVDADGNPLATDQRGPGFPRKLGHSVDIGAYEFAPLSQTISFGPLPNQTYGVAPITLSATDTSGLPVSFSVISGPATLSGSVLTVTGAGNVVVEASQPGNATYFAAPPVDESFTVAPAPLFITPTAGQSMVYGGTVPALTYTASGFVNGDTALLLTGALGTTATSTSVVGNYLFTLGSLTAGTNYALALASKPPAFAVTPDGTTTQLASSANPSVFGQAVAFTVTVTANAPGSGIPAGSVTFMDGSTTIDTGTLNSAGQATFGSSALSVGSHSITAVYSGDPNFIGSTSTALGQTVNKDGSTAAISSSASPSVLNQSISFTVTVSAAAPGSGTPTGTVQFSIDGSHFGSAVALAGGSATSGSISTLKLGNHTITASYSGDGNFTASTAPSFTQVVNKDNTTTNLVVTVNPSVYGQSISFTASVAAVAPGTGTPTGSVTFSDGTTTLKTVTLTAGAATYTSTKLATGPHSITATYNGNSTFATSTSALTQTINQDGASTVVTASANPSVYGQQVTFTATVSAAAPGSGTPGGTVTFMDGTTALGSATLSSGKASFRRARWLSARRRSLRFTAATSTSSPAPWPS